MERDVREPRLRSTVAESYAFTQALVAPHATEAQRRVIAGAIAKMPPALLDAIVEHGIKLYPLRDGEFYRDASSILRSTGIDQWPVSPAGLFVVAERAAYVRTLTDMTIVHELAHGADLALGSDGMYRSTTDPIVALAYDRGEYVSPYAASAKDEFWAESLRATLDVRNDPFSLWPEVTRAIAEAKAPTMVKHLINIVAELERQRTITRDAQTLQRYVDEREREQIELSASHSEPVVTLRAEVTAGAPASGPLDGSVDAAAKTKRDFRQDLTDKVIAELERGESIWQRPWTGAALPRNGLRGNEYNGGNRVVLMMTQMANSWTDPRWLTYRQAQEKGWQVRRGEHGTTVEYWKRPMSPGEIEAAVRRAVKDKPGVDERALRAKLERENTRFSVFYATVFNAHQIDAPKRDAAGEIVVETVERKGKPLKTAVMVPLVEAVPFEHGAREFTPIERAERILHGSGAQIAHDADSAYYLPSQDAIHLPPRERFRSNELYYATLAHELGHWTGHESRLNREGVTGGHAFGSEPYAREELRAELSSVFLAAETGLPHDIGQHAAYVESWISVLRKDKNELFRASADASKMADYVLALDPELHRARGAELSDEAQPVVSALRAPAASLPEYVPRDRVVTRSEHSYDLWTRVQGQSRTGEVIYGRLGPATLAIERRAFGAELPEVGERVYMRSVDGVDRAHREREVRESELSRSVSGRDSEADLEHAR